MLCTSRLKILVALFTAGIGSTAGPSAAAGHCQTTSRISANSAHAAFIDTNCHVWMWGFNNAGQLAATPGMSDKPAPARIVNSLPPLRDIVVALDHTLGISEDRRSYVWGSNEYLTCGGDGGSYSPRPQLVAALHDVQSISASKYVNAFLLGNGSVYEQGCINRKAHEVSEVPIRVSGLPKIQAIAVGSAHRLALSISGEVYAWGETDLTGQQGATKGEIRPMPIKVDGLPRIIAIAAGAWHSVALDSEGAVWAWGSNQEWQLGLPVQLRTANEGHPPMVAAPARVAGLPRVRAIAAGWFSTIALTEDSKVFIWGDRSTSGYPVPAEVFGLVDVEGVFPGGNAAVTDGIFARLHNGKFVRWQRNVQTYQEVPTPPAAGTVVPLSFSSIQ